MSWQIFEIKEDGAPRQWMLDDRFRNDIPGAELPNLSRVSFWCAKAPDDYYWHPEESADVEKIEDAVLRLADLHGDGWVVYVSRHATPGCLAYYFYSGDEADMDGLVRDLRDAFPGYRFEIETTDDPGWTQYARWFSEAAAGTANQAFMPAGKEGMN